MLADDNLLTIKAMQLVFQRQQTTDRHQQLTVCSHRQFPHALQTFRQAI